MNSYATTCGIEQRSMEILEPFIALQSHNGQWVKTAKGRLARPLQKSIGDVLFNCEKGKIWALEIKAEEEDKYGNLFLETWSNLARFTLGWMLTLNADILLYHFVNDDKFYTMSFLKLRQWAFHERNIWRYEERKQKKYDQLNDTWGRCVPIKILENDIGMKMWRPSELLSRELVR